MRYNVSVLLSPYTPVFCEIFIEQCVCNCQQDVCAVDFIPTKSEFEMPIKTETRRYYPVMRSIEQPTICRYCVMSYLAITLAGKDVHIMSAYPPVSANYPGTSRCALTDSPPGACIRLMFFKIQIYL